MFIILDRDGVINFDSDEYIKSPDEWIPIPGSLEAIAKLSKAGYQLVIASNQSGLARGLYALETLNAIHQKMITALEEIGGTLSKIYFCPHHPEEHCACRKPGTGMLLDFQNDFNVDLNSTIFIGDKLTDIQAAQAIHAKPILVKTGSGQSVIDADKGIDGVHICEDLQQAAEHILNGKI